jgi:hypothetical protein
VSADRFSTLSTLSKLTVAACTTRLLVLQLAEPGDSIVALQLNHLFKVFLARIFPDKSRFDVFVTSAKLHILSFSLLS